MGSLFSSPSPPAPIASPPELGDPRFRAMRRQRLEELKRTKGRRATVLTDGSQRRAAGLVSESEAEMQRRFAAMVQAAKMRSTDAPEQPEPKPEPKPEPPEEEEAKIDPCRDIKERTEQQAQEQETVRQSGRRTEFEITSREQEIERLKLQSINMPFVPGRVSRRPRLRDEIPGLAKDIGGAVGSRDKLDIPDRIRVLEKELSERKKLLNELTRRDGELGKNLDVLKERLQDCRAKNG